MQAVILAGGKNERFGSPKALASIGGKTMMEQIVATLPPEIQSIVIVTGLLTHHRIKHILRSDRRCEFVKQPSPLGTAIALGAAAPHIQDDFILMGADTLFAKADVANVASRPAPALAVRRVGTKKRPGAIFKDGLIVEKPFLWRQDDYESVMLYTLAPAILDHLYSPVMSERGEYEVQMVINHHLAEASEPHYVPIGPYHHITTQEDHERIQGLFSDID